jgi:hypothetical protein
MNREEQARRDTQEQMEPAVLAEPVLMVRQAATEDLVEMYLFGS